MFLNQLLVAVFEINMSTKVKVDMREVFKTLGNVRQEFGIVKWSFEHVEKVAKKLGYTVERVIEDGKELILIKEYGKKTPRALNAITSMIVHYMKKTGKSLTEVKELVKEALKG